MQNVLNDMFKNIFGKAFFVVKDCPFITLYFVLYLIVLFLIIPFMVAGGNLIQTGVLSILMILLTCAFASGWFNMIKAALLNYKENKTPEEKLEDAIKLKNYFFSGVSEYILPVIFGGIIFLILLYGHTYLSDFLFGKIDYILSDMAKFANDPNGLANYFANLPNSAWMTILKKGIFSYIVLSFVTLYLLFFSASLFLNRKDSKNPLFAIADSFRVMFCKFFETVSIFIVLIIINFLLMFLQGLFIENVVISFIAMILRIYFAAYIIVLIFALYYSYEDRCECKTIQTGAQCALDCNNSSDGGGEDKISD